MIEHSPGPEEAATRFDVSLARQGFPGRMLRLDGIVTGAATRPSKQGGSKQPYH